MHLDSWLKRQGNGAITRLQLSTGLSYTAIHRAARGKSAPTYETAARIAACTHGAVTVADICGPSLSVGPTTTPSKPAPRKLAKGPTRPPKATKAPKAPKRRRKPGAAKPASRPTAKGRLKPPSAPRAPRKAAKPRARTDRRKAAKAKPAAARRPLAARAAHPQLELEPVLEHSVLDHDTTLAAAAPELPPPELVELPPAELELERAHASAP